MAEIVDQLRLEIDDALRDIGRVETALDRALAPVELDIQVDERALAELENTLHEVQRIADRAATETQSIALAAGRAEVNFEDLARAMGITEAEARDLTAELLETQAAANRVEDSARDVARQLGLSESEANRLTTSLRQADAAADAIDVTTIALPARFLAIRNAAQGVAAAIAGIGGVALFAGTIRGANAAVQSFAQLEDSVNAVNVIFGEGAAAVLEFGETAAASAGLSEQAFNQAVTPIGSLLQNFGFDAREAAEAAVILVQRSADLASVLGGTVQDALIAVGAALRGESDPLERYGASISAARVEQFALAQGLAATKAEITDAIRLQARYGLILSDTEKVSGDFANTSGDLANAQRIAAAEAQNLVAELGEALAPAFEAILAQAPAVIAFFDSLVPQLAATAENAAAAGAGLAGFVSAVTLGFGQLGDVGGGVFDVLQAFPAVIEDIAAGIADGDASFSNFRAQFDQFSQRTAQTFIRTASQSIPQAIARGDDAVTAFGNAIAFLGRQDDNLNTIEQGFDRLRRVAGLTDEEARAATIALIDQADVLRLNADEVAFLNDQLDILNNNLTVVGNEVNQAAASMAGFGDPFSTITTRFTTFAGVLDEIPERLGSVAIATRLAAGLVGEALDPFDDATEKITVSAEEFFQNLTNQINEQAEFQAGLARLVAAGFGDLAEEIGKQGPGAQKAVDQFLNNLDLAERAERLLDGEGTEVARQIADELTQELAGSNLSPQIQQAFIALIEDGIFSNSQVENAIVTGTASAASTTISSFREALIEEAATFDASFLADSVGAALGASLDFSDLAVAQARKTVNAYERTFRDEFEISSPSKLMMRIGEQVAEGFLIGAQQTDLTLRTPAASITGGIASSATVGGVAGGVHVELTTINPIQMDQVSDTARMAQIAGSVAQTYNQVHN